MTSHHCSDLLFPSSGVPLLISQWHLTTVVTCFSFFRGASPDLAMASHHCSDLLFPSSGVPGKKAPCVALFSSLRCLSPPHNAGKATYPSYSYLFRCFSSFLPALKATCVALFPSLRCLSPPCNTGKATYFPNFPWQVAFIRNFWLLPAPAQVLRT